MNAKSIACAIASSCLLLGATGAMAADDMSKGSMAKDSMSKDSMSKDSMSKGTMSKSGMADKGKMKNDADMAKGDGPGAGMATGKTKEDMKK